MRHTITRYEPMTGNYKFPPELLEYFCTNVLCNIDVYHLDDLSTLIKEMQDRRLGYVIVAKNEGWSIYTTEWAFEVLGDLLNGTMPAKGGIDRVEKEDG